MVEEHRLDIEEIADAGHAVMVDQPAAFYGFLERWVAATLSA